MWARTGVALATKALPAGPTRERWRKEFRADLQVLGRRQQATYTVGVLANAWALRSALGKGRPTIMEKTMTTRTPLTCRLNLHHHWHIVSTEDGNRYKGVHRLPQALGLLAPAWGLDSRLLGASGSRPVIRGFRDCVSPPRLPFQSRASSKT